MTVTLDSLRRDVETLATPLGRMIGTKGHDLARQTLVERLHQLGLEPYRGAGFELPYYGERTSFCNIVGVLPGKSRTLPAVLVGAHYDSVFTAPFADDNAAAVAIALACAEQQQAVPRERDVVFAFFDAEEPPYFLTPLMGSIRFYEDERKPNGFQAALIMDLVGHDVALGIPVLEQLVPRARDFLFVTGADSGVAVRTALAKCSASTSLPVVAAPNEVVGDLSDHHVFRIHGVPYLFLSCGRWAHYHAATDTPDRLNYEKMARIAELLTSLVRELAGADESSSEPTNAMVTAAQLEIDLLHKAFAGALPLLLQQIGLTRLKDRADVEAFARAVKQLAGL